MGYVLGTLMEAGLPLVESLQSLREASSFYGYKRLYKYLAEEVDAGRTFSMAFRDYRHVKRYIPPSIQQMIVSAERSGSIPAVFRAVGKRYESKTESTAKNLTTVLEPLLLDRILRHCKMEMKTIKFQTISFQKPPQMNCKIVFTIRKYIHTKRK